MAIDPNHQWQRGTEKEKQLWQEACNLPNCELDAIAQKYNCDKSNSQLILDSKKIVPGHNYTELYDKIFLPFRHKPINILEIGMGVYPTNGYSLQLWLEYFNNATIHVVDNNPSNFKCTFPIDTKRVKFYELDQSKEQDLMLFVEKFIPNSFSIIIDDGSHVAEHQFLTLNSIFNKLLADNGIYVIEDLHDKSFIEYIPNLIKDLNNGHLLDNNNLENNLQVQSIHFYRSLIYLIKGHKFTR